MSIITTEDGTEIHHKDWGKGRPGAPHGLAYTHKDQLSTDLLAFPRRSLEQ